MTIDPNWPHLRKAKELRDGCIHLWAVNIDEPQATLESLRECFADDERRRAERFRFERPRARFIAGRAALRRILSSYLAIDPAEVCFVYDGLGKPSLDARSHTSSHNGTLRFNLAHSGGLAVLAITKDCEVGVDVEEIRTVRHAEGIAQRFFSSEEADDVLTDPQEIESRFFHCWTRKEAIVKTIGTGLQFPLDQFRVPVLNDEPSWVSLPAHRSQPPCECWLEPFVPCDGYLGAVSTMGEKRTCEYATYEL